MYESAHMNTASTIRRHWEPFTVMVLTLQRYLLTIYILRSRELTNNWLFSFCPKKSPWYFASGNPDGKSFDLFTDRSPTRHATNRRKVAALYSKDGVICPRVYWAPDKEFPKDRKDRPTINLQHWMQCYAFDVIGLITISRRFGLLGKGKHYSGMLNAPHQYPRNCASVDVYSELHSWIFRPVMMLGASGFAHMINFTAQQISEQKGSSGKDDFLSRVPSYE